MEIIITTLQFWMRNCSLADWVWNHKLAPACKMSPLWPFAWVTIWAAPELRLLRSRSFAFWLYGWPSQNLGRPLSSLRSYGTLSLNILNSWELNSVVRRYSHES